MHSHSFQQNHFSSSWVFAGTGSSKLHLRSLHIISPFHAVPYLVSLFKTASNHLRSFPLTPKLAVFQIHLKFLPVPVDVKSSSNGLLCCRGRTGDGAYYVCNPVTQQWKIIPKSEMDHGDDPALVLIFNPSLLYFEAEFKLVCAFRSIDFDDAIEFDIYSSKEGTWQTSGEINFAFKVMPGMGFHAKGVIYWTGTRGSLLAFDLAKERSKTVMGCYNSIAWGMVGGKLCRASVSGNAVTVTEVSDTGPITMQIIKKTKSWTHRATLDSALVGSSMEGRTVLFVGGDMVVVQIGKNIYSFKILMKRTDGVQFFLV